MARRQNMAEDVVDTTAKLPWWLGVLLAAVSFVLLHLYAGQEVPKAEGVNVITQAAASGLYRTLAMFGQYVLPALFLLGAFISACNASKGKMTMSGQKKSTFLMFKTLLVLCSGIVIVVLSTLYVWPIIIDSIHENDVKSEPPSTVKKTKEYSFTDAQINKAMREVEGSRENIISSAPPVDSNRYLYEIEFLSGGRLYSENVVATADTITFENEKGLVVSVSRSEVKNLKRLVQKGGTNSGKYSCRGKIHCSQMNSCEEAKFYLINCPGVKIDGDANGVPCEKQWCRN